MNNELDGINSRFDTVEDKISEPDGNENYSKWNKERREKPK